MANGTQGRCDVPGKRPDVAFQFNSMADLVEAHKAELLESAA